MHIPQKLRLYGIPIFDAIVLFFRFLGHLVCCIEEILSGREKLYWLKLFKVVYQSGVKLLVPIVLISAILGITLVLNIYSTLRPFNLEKNGFLIAQNIFFYDVLPFLINIIISVQMALNLVQNGRIRAQKDTHKTIIADIIPILIGVNICAVALYMYALTAVYMSAFVFFRYFLRADIHEFILQLSTTITGYSMFFSLLKTFLLGVMISVIACYYNYQVAVDYLPVRTAVSRIITRSFILLAVGSVYFKFFNH